MALQNKRWADEAGLNGKFRLLSRRKARPLWKSSAKFRMKTEDKGAEVSFNRKPKSDEVLVELGPKNIKVRSVKQVKGYQGRKLWFLVYTPCALWKSVILAA